MSNSPVATTTSLPEIAFYYPEPFWGDGDWIKNLVLFFDGVGLLIPAYMRSQLEDTDPSIVSGLQEHGLLHVFDPETWVDQSATTTLAESLTNVIASGALDKLSIEKGDFAELSMSRLGYAGDSSLAGMIHEELMRRGLATKSNDGVSIPMHRMVRSLVLVLLSQILRGQGPSHGFDLSPATDNFRIIGALRDILSVSDSPSTGNVVSFDMDAVGVDLGPVPIDEILAFRREHKDQHQKYARDVRLFVHEVSTMPVDLRTDAFASRQEQLKDLAADLRKLSTGAWKKPAAFTFGMVGAVVNAINGNYLAAALSVGGALLKSGGSNAVDTGAFSYMFDARGRFPVRKRREAAT